MQHFQFNLEHGPGNIGHALVGTYLGEGIALNLGDVIVIEDGRYAVVRIVQGLEKVDGKHLGAFYVTVVRLGSRYLGADKTLSRISDTEPSRKSRGT